MGLHRHCDNCQSTRASDYSLPEGWCSLTIYGPDDPKQDDDQSFDFCCTDCLIEYAQKNLELKGEEKI